MKPNAEFSGLGWRHMVWELVRFYRSFRGKKGAAWLAELEKTKAIGIDGGGEFPIEDDTIRALKAYLKCAKADFDLAFSGLRDEEKAKAFCESQGVQVGTTATKSKDHHQSSKALVAGVSTIAERVCNEKGLDLDSDPQRRAIWCNDRGLHVCARNLDGAVPGLLNPWVVWEIKEYWGKTSGGSKMSDAVYECQLVGRELREFEERAGIAVGHVVFVDGRDQWTKRKSDLMRFIDLFHQGIIDHLIVGAEVETEWEPLLRTLIGR